MLEKLHLKGGTYLDVSGYYAQLQPNPEHAQPALQVLRGRDRLCIAAASEKCDVETFQTMIAERSTVVNVRQYSLPDALREIG